MRYITPNQRLVLYSQDGAPLYKFEGDPRYPLNFRIGQLVVGTRNTNGVGNEIDAAPKIPASRQLMRLYDTKPDDSPLPTDLEKCGLGREFFEAPETIVTGPTAVVANKRYVVLSGAVLFNGIVYRELQEALFTTGPAPGSVTLPAGITQAIIGEEMPSLYAPNETKEFTRETFATVHLKDGSESDEYWIARNSSGYKPQDHGFVLTP